MEHQMTSLKGILLVILIFTSLHLSAFAQQKSSRIKNLSLEADVILTGRVVQKEASWNSSKTRIYTKTTLQINERLKGDHTDSAVEIISLGGEVDGVGELYSHIPNFKESEEVLVFLKKNKKDNRFRVLDGEEGKITVIDNGKKESKMTELNTGLKSLKLQIKSYIKK